MGFNSVENKYLAKKQIGKTTIVLMAGNILEDHSEAIVSYTDPLFKNENALARSITATAGIQNICDDLCRKRGNLAPGESVITSGGKLPSRHIIHTVLPFSKDPKIQLAGTFISILHKADERGFGTVSFPLVSPSWYPLAESSKAMVEAVSSFLVNNPASAVTEVRFFVRDNSQNESIDTFKSLLLENFRWEWQDDSGLWVPYSARINCAINASNNKSVTFSIKHTTYKIYPNMMIQKNCETKKKRKIRKNSMADEGIWQYETKNGWVTYHSVDMSAIESAFVSQMVDLSLSARNGHSYLLNFTKLQQTNVETGTVRKIQRLSAPENNTPSPAPILTVFGLAKDIQAAFHEIESYFKNHWTEKSIVIPLLDELPILRKELESLTIEFGVDIAINRQKLEIYGPLEYASKAQDRAYDIVCAAKIKNETTIPIHWSPVKDKLQTIKVSLTTDSQEYKEVKRKFESSLSVTVVAISRIQNLAMWQSYCLKKKLLEEENGGFANEKELFHGSSPDSIENICQHGFDRGFAGKNATALGKGVYFAVSASYSAQSTYAQPDASGTAFMFLAKVLTGECTKGDSSLRAPPARPYPKSHLQFNSVVDKTSSPSMYVVFKDDQAYPEYLITFKK